MSSCTRHVLELIALLKGRQSGREETAYEITTEIFNNGGCYRLYRILKLVFPQAIAYKVDCDRETFVISHVVAQIDNSFYDISGEFILSDSSYTRMEKMDDRDHVLASKFCYSFTTRSAIPC